MNPIQDVQKKENVNILIRYSIRSDNEFAKIHN